MTRSFTLVLISVSSHLRPVSAVITMMICACSLADYRANLVAVATARNPSLIHPAQCKAWSGELTTNQLAVLDVVMQNNLKP
jgi:hypothetical protein